MKKIFTTLAIMAMAAAGVSYAQAYDGNASNNQSNTEYIIAAMITMGMDIMDMGTVTAAANKKQISTITT